MQLIRAGEPYQNGFTNYKEGVHYQFDEDGHNIHIFMQNPTVEEVKSITTESIEWKLLTFPECLFILFRFENLDWFDVPYSWALASSEKRTKPSELSKAQSESIRMILVNATTGLVAGNRIVTPPLSFSQALNKAIINQIRHQISAEESSQKINLIYQDYPFPKDMLSILQTAVSDLDLDGVG